jgi:hypothetical protein
MLAAIGSTPIVRPECVATTLVDSDLKYPAGDLYASA